uniref:Ribosomal protein S3 n=1 Tax=Coleochaete scutata TaxID=3125 RepID=A0A6G9IG43_COLSC|nr:ribosomal protein S3 [Coleochaete scutata]
MLNYYLKIIFYVIIFKVFVRLLILNGVFVLDDVLFIVIQRKLFFIFFIRFLAISLEVYKQDRPGTEGASRATQANELGKTRKAKLPNESLLAKGHEMRKKIVKNSNYWRNIESVLSLEASNDVQIIPVRSTSLFQSASLLAQEICVQLMQKQSFPKIWKNISRSLNRQKPKVIKGMRISCSGRLNGAEIAKTESRQWGETSLHVFQDQIDYAKKFSLSPYGILGVKVWISYSE